MECRRQIPTQWVGNSIPIRQVELAKVAEIGCGKALAVTSCQLFGQALNQFLAVGRSLVAALKRLNDFPPNMPIGRDHGMVDHSHNSPTRIVQYGDNSPDKGIGFCYPNAFTVPATHAQGCAVGQGWLNRL